jgi:predicted GNAT family acetyltransferase
LTFNDFINETVTGQLSKEFPKSEAIFNIDEKPNKIILNIVLVPFKERNKGKGKKFMNRLIEIAKEKNKDIILYASGAYAEDTDMQVEDLVQWYKRLGFKETKDFKLNKEMVYKV